MNIRDLEYTVAVANHGHFGRAAAASHVSQPALSGQIRKLEEELGVTLFERTNRSVRVTPVGETIIAQARELLDMAALIRETARAHADPLAGTLRVGMIHTIGPYLTPILLPSVRHGLPNAELELLEDMTEPLEMQLLNGRIDAAIIATPVSDPHLAEIALYDEPFRVALPSGHRLAQKEEVAISDIRTEELLLLADGHCLRDQVLSACAGKGSEQSVVRTQETSLITILALVGAGAGVTLVPVMSLWGSWVTDSGIVTRKTKSRAAHRSVRLVFRASFPRRPALEKLADIICAILPDTVTPERR